MARRPSVGPMSKQRSPFAPMDRVSAHRTLNRRRFLGVGAGGLVLTVAGCGGDSDPTPTAVGMASPGAGTPTVTVPGFDDPRRWAGRSVRVGAWGAEVQDALRAAVFRPFAAATGAEVIEEITDYARLRASLDDGAVYADALVVDSVWAATAPAEGWIQALAADSRPAGISTVLGGTEHSLPAYAYAMVSAYRWDHLTSGPPTDWVAWWDTTRFPEPRALAKGAFGTFEFALLADGLTPDSLYPLDSQRAIDSLRRISGKIVERWWESGLRPVSWLASERVELTSAWHYRVLAGMDDGRPIDLQWNQGLLIVDEWVVPTGAANADVASDFLRFATSAEAQAAMARLVPLGPVHPGAFDLLGAEEAARLPTAPANIRKLIPQDVAWWAKNGLDAEQTFNAWLLGTI